MTTQQCPQCQIDESAVAQQIAQVAAMTAEQRQATIADLAGRSDAALHSVYGHQTGLIREVLRRLQTAE